MQRDSCSWLVRFLFEGIATAVAVAAVSLSARAWCREGHEIVAELASRQVSGASDRVVQWRDELTLSSVPQRDGGAERIAASALVRQGSATRRGRPLRVYVDARRGSDPLGPGAIHVYVDGQPAQTFPFSIVPAPVAQSPSPAPSASCIPRAQCCKVCSAGQACGATCISRSYTCHVGRGCACDGVEVCR